jgi:hypothetical protein
MFQKVQKTADFGGFLRQNRLKTGRSGEKQRVWFAFCLPIIMDQAVHFKLVNGVY